MKKAKWMSAVMAMAVSMTMLGNISAYAAETSTVIEDYTDEGEGKMEAERSRVEEVIILILQADGLQQAMSANPTQVDIIRNFMTPEDLEILDRYCEYIFDAIDNKLDYEEGAFINLGPACYLAIKEDVDWVEAQTELAKISIVTNVSSTGILYLDDSTDGYMDSFWIEDVLRDLYTVVLDRDADIEGLKSWYQQIKDGVLIEDVIWGFFGSNEFAERSLSDEEYVHVLYRAVLGREESTEESQNGVAELESGVRRDKILEKLLASTEFLRNHNQHALIKEPVELLVERLYDIALERKVDGSGRETWINGLTDGILGARGVVTGIIFSNEFEERNLSDQEYIECLYKIVLDREPEEEELTTWMNVINEDEGRECVFEGIMYSSEFSEWCQNFGINVE